MLTLWLIVLTAMSCQKADITGYYDSDEFIDAQAVVIGGNETEGTLTITANCAWTISEEIDWIDCKVAQGVGNQQVPLTTTGINPSLTNERKGTLMITSKGGRRVEVSIRQLPATGVLTLSTTHLDFSNEAGYKQLSISCNTGWSISGGADWLTTDKTSGVGDDMVQVTVTANNRSAVERSTVLTVATATGNITVNCTVKQAAATAPTLTAPQVTAIDKYSATVSSTYMSGAPVSEYGLCYSTVPNPDVSSQKVSFNGNSQQGNILVQLQGLESAVTYYVRAYAISEVGVGYSDQAIFTTQGDSPGRNDNPLPDI